jgi:hypothetical protein
MVNAGYIAGCVYSIRFSVHCYGGPPAAENEASIAYPFDEGVGG